MNGRPRLMTLLPSLMLARRNAVTTTVSSSDWRLPMMRLLNSLTLSREKTRTLLMKLETFLISLEMEAAPFMSLTSSADVLRLRKRNYNQPLKKLRLLLSKKKTKSCVPNLNLVRSDKRLTARSRRRKRSLTIPGKFVFIEEIINFSSTNDYSCKVWLVRKDWQT